MRVRRFGLASLALLSVAASAVWFGAGGGRSAQVKSDSFRKRGSDVRYRFIPVASGGCIVWRPLPKGTVFIRGTIRSAAGISVEDLRVSAEVVIGDGTVCKQEIGHTDAHGRYQIAVDRGRYRVTILHYQIPGPNQLLPRTYYPGVVRSGEAKWVDATAADVDGIDITIPPPLNSRTFKVTVKLPGGRPARNAEVMVSADGTFLGNPLLTGPMGDVMFDGVEALPYRFRAKFDGAFSEPVVVEPGSQPAEVNLTLPKPKLTSRGL